MVAIVDPKEGSNARKFPAAINTAAKGGQPSTSSLGGKARTDAMASEQRSKYYKTMAIMWATIILIVAILFIVGNHH